MTFVTDASDPSRSADLAAYSVMRAVLPSRSEGTEATRADIRRIVDDLEQRFGPDAVVTLVGSLALKALWPIEQQAQRCVTSVAAELDAEEQRVLAMLDQDRRERE